ncbi:MAG: hypothetical protein HY223_07125 [Thaumarchaeota archaeon]|nr:hypothetical protein [Nitrososphaerota archaeon]
MMMFVSNANAVGVEVRDKEGRLVYSQEGGTKNNPYEFGVWAFPVIIINLILLLLGALFYKKWLPNIVKKIIDFVLHFEVSKKIAFVIVAGLIAIYVISNVSRIWNSEEVSWGDYQTALQEAKNFSYLSLTSYLGFRFLLLSISLNFLGNIRIIPFIVSISLVVLTYYFTTELSKKRFAGIISVVILLQSNLFLKYSVSSTEDNDWTLFYVLSLYLIYKKWFLSPLSYALSLISKPLVAIFLPMTFFLIYMSSLSKKEKIRIALLYTVTILIPVSIELKNYGESVSDPNAILIGFSSLENFLRFDGLILIFLFPLIIGLFLASKRGMLHADSLMILIAGVLWSAPLLAGFTEITNQPYRFVPLVVFFAIGVSILFSNNVNRSLVTTKNYRRILAFIFAIATVVVSMTSVIFPARIT